MRSDTSAESLLQALAHFRYQLRTFLQFSEQAARRANLHPQQHQLLLQVAAAPQGAGASIAYAAARLGLRHHSVVELVDRSVTEGLLVRTPDPQDRRRVFLEITVKGRKVLKGLSRSHARELRELGPALLRSLRRVESAHSRPLRRPGRRPRRRSLKPRTP
jgi:DNA-binding MarR family transcriptional regulator